MCAQRYDNAKYHLETVDEFELPEIHAFIHGGLYLGWIIENEFLDGDFLVHFMGDVQKFKKRELTGPELLWKWDGALTDDMFNDEGNKFSKYYFDFENGRYIEDYTEMLAKELPSPFHVKDTWDNFNKLSTVISERHKQWKKKVKK